MRRTVRDFFWLSGENYGLVSQLLAQAGNNGATKVRTIFNGITSGGEYQGSYSAAATYSQYDIIGYPNDAAPLRYRANQSTSAGQSPDTNPEKWDLLLGLEWLQDLGGGVYSRYSLGIRNDAMIRLNGLEVGTYATTSFTRRTSNYTGQGATATIGTSASTFAVPGTHPSSRSLTTGAGLAASLPDSETLGTCNDTFSIPTITPTTLSLTLPTGLTLTEGETITLYGNASNFVVVIVARYNSSTGAFYGASTNSVGTGSFSSWTVKRERLIYIYDTTDSAGKNFYCLVQTYDNATGALVVNSVANISTISNSDWTIARAKTPNNPGAAGSTFFNNDLSAAYAAGHWMMGSFTGDRLELHSVKDNRGTDWVFIYLHGDEPNTPADVTISTYNATTLTLQATTVFTGLTKGTHYFMAVSKAGASGTNTRAWVYADTDTADPRSFFEKYEYDVFTPSVILGPRGGESFGEIAWKFRDTDGADTTQWLPEHANVKTTEINVNPVAGGSVVIDLTDENDPYHYKFQDASRVTLTQVLDVVHPQATGNMGLMNVSHIYSSKGIDYTVQVTWLQAGRIETGYNNMVLLGEAWFNKVLCQDGQVINRPADNTSVNLSASQESQQSYLFYSTGASPLEDYVIGQYWANPTRDWRIGGSSRGTPFIQDFAGASNAKWYPYVWLNYDFAADEIMTVQGKLFIGNKGNLNLV